MSFRPLTIESLPAAAESARRAMLIYLAVALPVCLAFLGWSDVHSMEGIVALGAGHMLQSGEWLVPKLYGEIYAFKPAMAYWLAAGSEAIFGGGSEFALRLPFGLCGVLLGVAFVWGMGRLVSPRCGLYSGLAAVTSALFSQQAAIAGFDMPVALGLGVAVLAAARNLSLDRASAGWWSLAYAGLLFAFLGKGLPAVVIFAPGLVVAAISLKRFMRLLESKHLVALGCFVLAAGMYVVLAYRAEGAGAFHQHLGEIALRSSQWTPRKMIANVAKPAVIVAVLLPWSLVVTGWLCEAGSEILRRWPGASGALARAAKRFLPLPLSGAPAKLSRVTWAFLLVGIATFLTVPTDDARYYLALVGPLAMLAGLSLERLPDPWPTRTGIALTAIGLVTWGVYVGVIHPRRAEKRSLRTVAEAFAPHVPPDSTVWIDTQDSFSSLFYYLDRPVRAWRHGKNSPTSGEYIVSVNSQSVMVDYRRDLMIEEVTEAFGADKRAYRLERVMPATP